MGLGQRTILFKAETRKFRPLPAVDEFEGPVTSVALSPDGYHLAVGLNSSCIQLWDVGAFKLIAALKNQQGGRVGSLSWNENVLTVGMADGTVEAFDTSSSTFPFCTYKGAAHRDEICSLRWSPCGLKLASGSRDGILSIRDWRNTVELFSFQDQEKAPIKSLAWAPIETHHLAFASGCCIKVWSGIYGTFLKTSKLADTRLTGLAWGPDEKEILSSQMSASPKRQFYAWKYPSLQTPEEISLSDALPQQISVPNPPPSPIYHMTQSADGCRIATLQSNKTLRFWKMFERPAGKNRQTNERESILSCSGTHIR